VLPDDDKRYAIETCRCSESVLKKWFKNKWHTITAFVGCVIISNRSSLVQYVCWTGSACRWYCTSVFAIHNANVCISRLRPSRNLGDKYQISEKFAVSIQKIVKGKGLPQQTEVAQGVPGTLRPRIFLTFGTTRAVGRQPYAPAAFTPGEIPGTHF